MASSDDQYDTVMPKPSAPRVLSTPRKPAWRDGELYHAIGHGAITFIDLRCAAS